MWRLLLCAAVGAVSGLAYRHPEPLVSLIGVVASLAVLAWFVHWDLTRDD